MFLSRGAERGCAPVVAPETKPFGGTAHFLAKTAAAEFQRAWPGKILRNNGGLFLRTGQRERAQIHCRNAGRRICLHTSAAAAPDLLLENSRGERSQSCHSDDVNPEERIVRSQFTCRKQEATCLWVQINGSLGWRRSPSNNSDDIYMDMK